MPRLEREPRSEDPHLSNLPSSEEVRIVSGVPEHSTREQPLVEQELIGSQSLSDAEPSEEQQRAYDEAWRDAHPFPVYNISITSILKGFFGID